MKLFHTIAEAEDFVKQTNRFAVCELLPEQTKKSATRTNGLYEVFVSMPEESQLTVDHQTLTAYSGDIFFVEPDTQHSFQVQKDSRLKSYLLLISPSLLTKFSSTETNLEDIFLIQIPHHSRRVSLTTERRAQVEALLQKILSAEGFGSDLIELVTFAEIMTILGSLHLEQREQQDTCTHLRKGGLAYRLIRYIDTQITEPLQISDIASAFYISDSYACRIFKQEYAITINKYIQDRRLTIAKSLLQEGYSVTETCERSGFNDYTNFIKLFTRTVGTSPKRYSLYGTSC